MDTQITLWSTVWTSDYTIDAIMYNQMYHGHYDRGVAAVVVNTGTAFRAKPATTFGS